MTWAFALCGLAFLATGVTGAPLDPFFPLLALVGVADQGNATTKLLFAAALGLVTAALTGDIAAERAVLYLTTMAVGTHVLGALQDSVRSRVTLATLGLGAALATRTGLSWAGALPAPSEHAVEALATLLWTGAHAALCLHLPRR